MSRYEEFPKLKAQADAQKSVVLSRKKGGYEPHLHSLYREVLPDLTARHGAQKGRNMITLLAFLHAHKVGQPDEAKGIPKEIVGWAFVSNRYICDMLAMKENTLISLKKALKEERLVIIRKSPYKGNEKDYYLPFYFPYDDEKEEEEVKTQKDDEGEKISDLIEYL